MLFGNELIRENGVPIQDFKIHPFNRNKKLKHRKRNIRFFKRENEKYFERKKNKT